MGLKMRAIVLLAAIAVVFFAQISHAWPTDEELINRTRAYFGANGWFGPPDPSYEIDEQDFVFRGPIIGPFNYADNAKLFNKSQALPFEAFPDLKPNVQACWIDHNDDAFGRHVYCALAPTGTQTKPWASPGGVIPASNKTLQSSGEVWSVLWNEKLKIRHTTIGYPVNSHRGNNCGFGAAFALLCATGAKSYNSLLVGYIAEWTLGRPRERSKVLPSWWAEYCQGPQCP